MQPPLSPQQRDKLDHLSRLLDDRDRKLPPMAGGPCGPSRGEWLTYAVVSLAVLGLLAVLYAGVVWRGGGGETVPGSVMQSARP